MNSRTMAKATDHATRTTPKGAPTRSRTEHVDAVRRANRMAMMQWWLVIVVLVAAVVLVVVLFSGDGSGVTAPGGPVNPLGHG